MSNVQCNDAFIDEMHKSELYRIYTNEEIPIIKNEDVETNHVVDPGNLGFDIDTDILNATFDETKLSNSTQSLADICSSLNLDPNQAFNIANEEIVLNANNREMVQVKMISEQDLTAEYLMNASHDDLLKEEIKPSTSSLESLSSSDLLPGHNGLDMGGNIHMDDADLAAMGRDSGRPPLHFVKYVPKDGKHIKIWECGVCGKEFGHQYTLMRHLPTHTDERKFRCATCGKAFRQMSTLSQHKAIHSADRPYVCELCRKTFNRVSTLISHRKTHSGLKPHQCHLCHKAFHQKGNLRNHIFTHTNERPYKCDICQKGFNQMSNLMCHKLKAHQRNDKPKYTCRLCNKEFPKRMALRNHEEYKHGIKTQPHSGALVNNGNGMAMGGIQTRVVQGDDGEKMHIIHIPELGATQNVSRASNPSPSNTRVRYTNGVLVDAINTSAMRQAQQAQILNGTSGSSASAPFALLRPIGGIPVLVRVLSAPNGKHMLVPATAEDLRAHGKITITENNQSQQNDGEAKENFNDDLINSNNGTRTTIQIKIPVVATVVQKFEPDGTMSMSVESPGPDNKQMIQDSINNTVENHKNLQLFNSVDKLTMAMSSSPSTTTNTSQAAMHFHMNDFMEDQKQNYTYLEETLNSLAHTENLGLQSFHPGENINLYNENMPLNTFEIIDRTKHQASNYPQDIILEDQSIYNEVNSLTLYNDSNEFTMLP